MSFVKHIQIDRPPVANKCHVMKQQRSTIPHSATAIIGLIRIASVNLGRLNIHIAICLYCASICSLCIIIIINQQSRGAMAKYKHYIIYNIDSRIQCFV